MTPTFRSTVLPHLALLSVALIYSINFFISKQVFPFVPAFAILSIRSITGIVFFGMGSWLVYRHPFPPKQDILRMIFCAISGITLNQLFFLWGLQITTEFNSAVLMITSPIFVFLIGYFLKTEKISALKLIGIALSFIGAVMLILQRGNISIGGSTLWGDLMIVINACSYSCYLVAVKPLNVKYPPVILFGYLFAIGGILNVLMGWHELSAVEWSNLPMETYYGVAFIAIFTTLLAYGLNAWAMKTVPAGYVGIYIYLQPVLVTLITICLPHKAAILTPMKLFYMLLVFVGVGMVLWKGKKTR